MDTGTYDTSPEYYEDIYIKEMPEHIFIDFEIVTLYLVEGYTPPTFIKGKNKCQP